MNVPTIAYAHGNEYPRDPSQTPAKSARIKEALGKATHLIAVSHDTEARLTPYLPAGLTPTIINPPVEPPVAPSADDKVYAENLWPKDGTRLVALCRLIEWKGIDQAILSLASLRDKNIDAQLVIAGIGDDRARLERLVKDHDLTDRIVFAGRVEGGRKSALLESADIFVQPGRKVGDQCEGFGITYLEAALHGLPTLSGNAGGAPDASIDGQTGFIIDATQTENVTAALEKLITDKGLRARMAKAARAHGQAALWPQQISRILALKDR
jgi:phosphatidylinositol alpha-1,6-mannosyltransferase